MRYDLSSIMRRAWRIFRKAAAKSAISFSEALRRAWAAAKVAPINAARIEAARIEAGIDEAIDTWSHWRELGCEVVHGSLAVLKVVLDAPSKGIGKTFIASFFTASQVVPLGSQDAA